MNNLSTWSPKKKILAMLGIIFAIVGIILTIYLVQRQQDLRGRAEKSTTISLTPPNQSVAPGEDAMLDVTVNPGVNQINFVKFTIKVDPERFDPSLVVFNVNPDSPLKPLSDSSFTSYTEDGNVTFTLSVGVDATKVIRETVIIGVLLIPAREDATTGSTEVVFNEPLTEVRSTRGDDPFDENVLSSTTPATITITGECRADIATCSWDESENATKYRYKITNVTDSVIVEENETTQTFVEFPSAANKTYRCEVIAVNECAEAEPSETEATCVVPSGTPVPTETPSGTPSPTPIVSPSPSPSPVPSASPTPRPSSTPTPIIPGVTSVPTPTTPVVITSAPTPTTQIFATATPTTPETEVIVTPVPTLPPTGSPLVIGGIIGGILFVLGGIFLIFL